MSGVAFLLLAIGLSVLGSLLLWWRERTPSSTQHTIDAFSRDMEALAPRPAPPSRRPPPATPQ
ncbi:MAG: hypothetical protein M3R01_02110 [Actinomycetota bacterium]|nr:hypothetical protein [Actinomycetota bacterium]